MIRLAVLFISFLPLLSPSPSQAVVFYYTHGKANGGFARLAIQDRTGEWQAHQAIGQAMLEEPKKLAVAPDGGHALVTSDECDRAWFFQLGTAPALKSELKLGGKTSEIQVLGTHAMLAVTKGWFYWIDLQKGGIEKTWNARKELKPAGRKGEDFLFMPERNLALVTFQKDSDDGKELGSRLLLFDMARFVPRHDLHLPRDHQGLHIDGNLTEQGPSPEMVFVAPKSNSLVLSLDLYGGFAFADLDAALGGNWKNLQYISSSMKGEWGSAFPDRGLFFETGNREYLLVSNASENGGIVLVDIAGRRLKQEFPCQAGAENPVLLPSAKKAVTVVSGKVKGRAQERLSREFSPESDLLVFDLSALESGGDVVLERIPLGKPVTRIQAISPSETQLLLLLCGEEGSQEWTVYDLATRTVKHQEPAKGVVSRVVAWRPAR